MKDVFSNKRRESEEGRSLGGISILLGVLLHVYMLLSHLKQDVMNEGEG